MSEDKKPTVSERLIKRLETRKKKYEGRFEDLKNEFKEEEKHLTGLLEEIEVELKALKK